MDILSSVSISTEFLVGTSEADSGRAVSTLRRRLSAIRLMHIAGDLPSPHEAKRVSLVLKGIANDQKHRKPKKAKPALDADIKRMVDALDTDSAQGLRDRDCYWWDLMGRYVDRSSYR